jgi:hypothetical protein
MIAPDSKTSLTQKLCWFVATTMVSSGFCPYHGLWHKDTQTKRIDITRTYGTITRALGLNILAPQPEIYHAYGTAFFCDFIFKDDINIIVNNKMILE